MVKKSKEVSDGVSFQSKVVEHLRKICPYTVFEEFKDIYAPIDVKVIGCGRNYGKEALLEIKGRRISYDKYDDVMLPSEKLDYVNTQPIRAFMLTIYIDGACLINLKSDAIKQVKPVDRYDKKERNDRDNRSHIFYYKTDRLNWSGPVLK